MFKISGLRLGPIAGAVVALAVMATQSFATTISIDPASSTIGLGSVGSFDVVISDIASGVDLAGFDVTVNYDPLVLGFDSFIFSTELGIQGVDAFGFVTPGAGSVNLYNVSFADLSGQPDAFTLGSIYFKGIQLGATSELSITVNDLSDANGDAISGATVKNASVSVPEPSATMLFVTGLVSLIGLGGIRRKVS